MRFDILKYKITKLLLQGRKYENFFVISKHDKLFRIER